MEKIIYKLNGRSANEAILTEEFADVLSAIEPCFILRDEELLYDNLFNHLLEEWGGDFYKDLYLIKKIVKIHDNTDEDWRGFSPRTNSLMLYDSFHEKYRQFTAAESLEEHLAQRYNIKLIFTE